MLTLTFLGVGSAFAKRNFQSNALIEVWTQSPSTQATPDDVLLLDFGNTGPAALYSLMTVPGFDYLQSGGRIDYEAVGRVLVTHVHGDHVGGLEELAVIAAYGPLRDPRSRRRRPILHAAPDVLALLWTHTLEGALGVRPGRRATLDDYFDVQPLHAMGRGEPDRFLLGDRYRFSLFPTDHIRINRPYDWPSYGLLIGDESTGESVVYTGDTRFDVAGLESLLSAARLIFHDVQLEDQPDAVHPLLSALRTLPEAVRKQMILYHLDDRWDDPAYAFVDDEFAGFARPQMRYTLFE